MRSACKVVRSRLAGGSRLLFVLKDTATTEIYPLPLHDALPISAVAAVQEGPRLTVYVGAASGGVWKSVNGGTTFKPVRSEEHTSELQSQSNLVCRLLL